MSAQFNIWEKLSKIVVFLLFVAAAAGVVLWYLPLIRQNEALRKEIVRLSEQIEHQKKVNEELSNAIQSARSDPRTVERLAREKLGYARPGEAVIRFNPVLSTNTAPGAAR